MAYLSHGPRHLLPLHLTGDTLHWPILSVGAFHSMQMTWNHHIHTFFFHSGYKIEKDTTFLVVLWIWGNTQVKRLNILFKEWAILVGAALICHVLVLTSFAWGGHCFLQGPGTFLSPLLPSTLLNECRKYALKKSGGSQITPPKYQLYLSHPWQELDTNQFKIEFSHKYLKCHYSVLTAKESQLLRYQMICDRIIMDI